MPLRPYAMLFFALLMQAFRFRAFAYHPQSARISRIIPRIVSALSCSAL